MERKTTALELPETSISSSVVLFNKTVLGASKTFIPRGRRRDYQPYWTPELDNLHKALDQTREKMESSPKNANVEAHSKAKTAVHKSKNTIQEEQLARKDSITEHGKRHDRPVKSDKSAKQRQSLKKQNSHRSKP